MIHHLNDTFQSIVAYLRLNIDPSIFNQLRFLEIPRDIFIRTDELAHSWHLKQLVSYLLNFLLQLGQILLVLISFGDVKLQACSRCLSLKVSKCSICPTLI